MPKHNILISSPMPPGMRVPPHSEPPRGAMSRLNPSRLAKRFCKCLTSRAKQTLKFRAATSRNDFPPNPDPKPTCHESDVGRRPDPPRPYCSRMFLMIQNVRSPASYMPRNRNSVAAPAMAYGAKDFSAISPAAQRSCSHCPAPERLRRGFQSSQCSKTRPCSA